jgi:hypothetical protein
LKGIAEYSVLYSSKGVTGPEGLKGSRLQGYYNADYVKDIIDRKSVTRHLFTINEGLITWTSTK